MHKLRNFIALRYNLLYKCLQQVLRSEEDGDGDVLLRSQAGRGGRQISAPPGATESRGRTSFPYAAHARSTWRRHTQPTVAHRAFAGGRPSRSTTPPPRQT
jgi:hypothetical protein